MAVKKKVAPKHKPKHKAVKEKTVPRSEVGAHPSDYVTDYVKPKSKK